MLKQNPLRLLAGALLLVACSSLPASAAPITIGLFSWQYDASNVDFTLGLDIFVPDWPTSLTLDDVFVDFMRSDGSTGQAFFGGYDGGGVGQKVSVGSSSGSIQVPGFGVGLDPLPQDIVTAALHFSFDGTLGTVLVDTLGSQFDSLTGDPTFDLREIVFDAASTPAPVPEPSTLLLFGSPALALALRQMRRSLQS
jgi:hypothetical protein